MTRTTLGLSIALSLSLLGNGAQFLRSMNKCGDDAPRAAAAPVASGSPVAAPIAAPARGSAAATTGVASLPATCPDHLVALEARLAVAEREVEARLRDDERFERAAPSPQSEARLRPLLERVFTGAPADIAWDVECRGGTCRLEVVEPESGSSFDWSGRLQADEEQHALITSSTFTGGGPGQDPVSKEPIFTRTAFFGLRGEGTISGLVVLGELLTRFGASPAVAACKAEFPAVGWLSLRLDLRPAEQRIEIQAGGSLAVEPGGGCLRRALEDLAAATTIPAGALRAVQYTTVQVP